MKNRKENALRKNTTIIIDVIEWIESNLHNDLCIDIVALKSGYSKWHLQRMFKNITGQSMASYIRVRKLKCTAIALQLLELSIIDVITAYNFRTQQSYTRTFHEYFNTTPSKYRKNNNLNDMGENALHNTKREIISCCASLQKAFPTEVSKLKLCQLHQ